MGDPVSGVILGLPGLLTACVDCFKYVQIARNFGSDYERCLLALDITKLRLSRWGVSVGISSNDSPFPNVGSLDEKDSQLAKELLESIMRSFEQAKTTSRRIEMRLREQNPTGSSLAAFDPETDLSLDYSSIHRTLDGIVTKRQTSSSILGKAKWALYEKGRFDNMVAEVRGFVGELIELFPPAVKAEEKGICNQEVEGLKNEELVLLRDSVGSDDPTLQASACEVLVARGFGHLVRDFENIDSGLNIGDVNAAGRQSLGHTVERFSNSGKSIMSIGNRNL